MFLVLSCLFFCVSSQFIAYPTAFDGSTYVPPTGTIVSSFTASEVDTSIASSTYDYKSSTAYSERKTTPLTDVTSSVSAAATSSIYYTPYTPDSEVSTSPTSTSSTSNIIYESNGLFKSNHVGYATSTTVIHTYYETVPCTTTSASTSSSSSSSTTPISDSSSSITSTITTSSEPSFALQSRSTSLAEVPNESQPILYSTSSIDAISAFKTSTKTASTPSFKYSGAKYNSSSYCSPTIVISTVTVTGRIVTKTELALTTVTSIVS